jgi:death-on-curing family protein
MLNLEPLLQAEYERTVAAIPDDAWDKVSGALSILDVLQAHFLIANHFTLEGEGIAGVGPRDIGLLISAVSRQHVSFGGKAKWHSHFDVCATLFYGLIKNHAFYDANKRTALLSVLTQLYRAQWCPAIPEREIEDFTVDIADNNLKKFPRFRDIQNQDDPEVKFISWYLKKNCRKVDNTLRVVTFRELDVILRRYGFEIRHSSGNKIDIIRVENKKSSRFFGLISQQHKIETRVGQIGFPRWSSQVSKSDIKRVREMTNLTHARGVDSGAFFSGLNPMQSLLTTYNAPLMRLASR